MRWALLLVIACSEPPSTYPDPVITIHVPPPPPPPDHAKANQILAAYGAEHALGVARRTPTAAELAAAADADPLDAIDAETWREMAPPMRMLRAWEAGQHVAWHTVCFAGVAAWWQSAKAIDDEMVARLAQPLPSDFYAGMVAWHDHRAWWEQRTKNDVAFSSLARAEVGAWHRLVVAQDAWAARWVDPPEPAIAEASLLWDGRELEPLEVEQAKFCKVQQKWPPEPLREPGVMRRVNLPYRESGRIARVDPTGTELRVTRRDRETILETVPPCKRVRCTGIDCAMDDRHGWRDVCVEKQITRVHDFAFVLHLDTPPVVPKLGDTVSFFLSPSGHAVLASVARGADPPYFELPIY